MKVDPHHSDAWFQIGRIYTYGEAGRYRNARKAEAAYRRQLEVNSRHFGARTYLGQIMKQSGRTDEAVVLLKPVVVTSNAHQRRALLELVEVHQTARDHDLAEALCSKLSLTALEPEERAVYYDLSLVAIGDELSAISRRLLKRNARCCLSGLLGGPGPCASDCGQRTVDRALSPCGVCPRAFWRVRVSLGRAWRGICALWRGRIMSVRIWRTSDLRRIPGVLAVKDRLMNQAGGALQLLLLEPAYD